MKLWETFRFELAYQSRRPSTWIYLAVFLLLTRYMTMELSTEFVTERRESSLAEWQRLAGTSITVNVLALIAIACALAYGLRIWAKKL